MGATIDYRETLITYLRSDGIDSAAKSLNISRAAMSQRLVTMRKRGVNVPKKRASTSLSNLEVAQLNSIIKKYQVEEAKA